MNWQDRAACRGAVDVMFPLGMDREHDLLNAPPWPKRGCVVFTADELDAIAKAKAVCAGCAVVEQCAVDMAQDQHGVRAGTTVDERCRGVPVRTRADKLREQLAAADDGADAEVIAARVGVTARTVWRHRQLRLGA